MPDAFLQLSLSGIGLQLMLCASVVHVVLGTSCSANPAQYTLKKIAKEEDHVEIALQLDEYDDRQPLRQPKAGGEGSLSSGYLCFNYGVARQSLIREGSFVT